MAMATSIMTSIAEVTSNKEDVLTITSEVVDVSIAVDLCRTVNSEVVQTTCKQ